MEHKMKYNAFQAFMLLSVNIKTARASLLPFVSNFPLE